MHPDRLGVVLKRQDGLVQVRWDGTKAPRYYHEKFIEEFEDEDQSEANVHGDGGTRG